MTIAQRLGQINAASEMSTKAKAFCNLARCIALGRGNHGSVQGIAHDNRILLGPTIKSIVESHHSVYTFAPDMVARQKAAVSAGTTADSGWALPLSEYNTLANAFLESLRNFGIFDQMLPFMRRVPFRTRIGASTSGITGVTAQQQQVKPISKLVLSGTQITERKAAAILVVTNELARFGDNVAGNLFATELSNAVAVATDSEFVSVLTTSATSAVSSGVTAENVRHDLRVMLSAIDIGNQSQLFLLMSAPIAKTLSVLHTNAGDAAFPDVTYKGGNIAGITVAISNAVTAGSMILADASQVAAASETVQLSAAGEASVQMDSTPDSPPTSGTNLVSLWQNNLTGLKAERFFGCEKLTTSGVAVTTSVAYVGDSPGP